MILMDDDCSKVQVRVVTTLLRLAIPWEMCDIYGQLEITLPFHQHIRRRTSP
jgi:hypothetical protein